MDLHAFANGWIDAFNRRDWDAYAVYFADTVTYLTPGREEPLVGRDTHVAQDQKNAGSAKLVPRLIVVADDDGFEIVAGARRYRAGVDRYSVSGRGNEGFQATSHRCPSGSWKYPA